MPVEYAPTFRPRTIRHVLFDWDGTLSLVRGGWADVMTEQFVAHLGEARRAEVRTNIARLNGKPTIHQMEWLAEAFGDRADAPEIYLEDFLARLQRVIDGRLAADRGSLIVPGAREVLENLRQRGITLHLASGTDECAVRHEAELLGLAHYFGDRLHGAPSDPHLFSKRAIIDAILRDHAVPGTALLAFGDGPAEIAETKAVGGIAIAVASDEERPGSGRVDAAKRAQLLACGADAVIADFRDAPALLTVLLDHES